MNRLDPERSSVMAAGATLLAAAILMVNVRLDEQWGEGTHLILALAAFAPVFWAGLSLPLEDGRPWPAQSVLVLAGLALLAISIIRLAEVFGVDQPFDSSGTVMWMAALFAAVAAYAAVTLGSATSTLLGAVAAALAVVTFVDEVFDPEGPGTARWILLLLIVGFVAAAVSVRGERPRHSVQLVNAAAIALLGIAASFVVGFVAGLIGLGGGGGRPGFGWELVLLAGSFALIAYAAIDREPGPGYLGATSLLLAVTLIGVPDEEGEGSLLGWPIVLLLAGAAALAAGFLPTGRANEGRPRTRERAGQ